MQPQGRRRFRSRKAGRHGRGRKQGQAESALDQLAAEPATTAPCPVCGHPVDPKRMHFHMVRFHGASMRSKTGPAQP